MHSKARTTLRLVLFFVLVLASSVPAQIKWIWDFEGALGSEKIGFSLSSTEFDKLVRGDNLRCSYFYVRYLKDISLRCSIAQDGTFTFVALDPKGKVVETFTGVFLKNEIDKLEGTWTENGTGRTLTFKLRLAQGTSGDFGQRYKSIDAQNDMEFERKVQAFRGAVLTGQKQTVVSFIKFPISVRIGKKRTEIRSKASFLNNYDKILDKDFVDRVRQTVPHNLFHRDVGAMLGNGIVWFWGNGKVIGINN